MPGTYTYIRMSGNKILVKPGQCVERQTLTRSNLTPIPLPEQQDEQAFVITNPVSLKQFVADQKKLKHPCDLCDSM